jgi:hypothetical protein
LVLAIVSSRPFQMQTAVSQPESGAVARMSADRQ